MSKKLTLTFLFIVLFIIGQSILGTSLLGQQANKKVVQPHLTLQVYIIRNFEDEQALKLYNETQQAMSAKWRCFTNKTGVVKHISNRQAVEENLRRLRESKDKEFLYYTNRVEDLIQEERHYIEDCWEGEMPSPQKLRAIVRNSKN